MTAVMLTDSSRKTSPRTVATIGVKNTPMTAFLYYKTVNLIQVSTIDKLITNNK
jgi:hypothetical protein